jgi:hypothetical protein
MDMSYTTKIFQMTKIKFDSCVFSNGVIPKFPQVGDLFNKQVVVLIIRVHKNLRTSLSKTRLITCSNNQYEKIIYVVICLSSCNLILLDTFQLQSNFIG